MVIFQRVFYHFPMQGGWEGKNENVQHTEWNQHSFHTRDRANAHPKSQSEYQSTSDDRITNEQSDQ